MGQKLKITVFWGGDEEQNDKKKHKSKSTQNEFDTIIKNLRFRKNITLRY